MTSFQIVFKKTESGDFQTYHNGDMMAPDILIGLEMFKKSLLEQIVSSRPIPPSGGKVIPLFTAKKLP